MELREYLRIARRRWLLIFCATLVCAGAAVAYVETATPQYDSQATLFVSTPADSNTDAYQGSLYSVQRVQSYSDIVNGQKLARQVIGDLHLSLTPAQLSQKIKATAVADTVLLQVDVTDPSPVMAQRIATSVVSQLQQMVRVIETPPGKTVPLLKVTEVDPPVLPQQPASPSKTRDVGLGIVLGLLLGFSIAVLRETLDNTVKHPQEVPGLHDVPLLSALELDGDVSKHPLINSLPSSAPRVEAFRVLRTNLQFLDVDSPSSVFVVTSSVPGEGKSTVASNIAVALASSGSQVLLIDGDLRRSRVATMTGLEGAVGMTSVLLGRVRLTDAVQMHESGLHVLTAGPTPPNPAELLQSRAMRDLLEEARTRYDVVLIDATPLLPVTDAAVLTAQADGALVVVRHGKTTRDQLTGALDRIHQVDGHVLGIVMNMVPRKRTLSAGYGYGYGYSYDSHTGTEQPSVAAVAPVPATEAETDQEPALVGVGSGAAPTQSVNGRTPARMTKRRKPSADTTPPRIRPSRPGTGRRRKA